MKKIIPFDIIDQEKKKKNINIINEKCYNDYKKKMKYHPIVKTFNFITVFWILFAQIYGILGGSICDKMQQFRELQSIRNYHFVNKSQFINDIKIFRDSGILALINNNIQLSEREEIFKNVDFYLANNHPDFWFFSLDKFSFQNHLVINSNYWRILFGLLIYIILFQLIALVMGIIIFKFSSDSLKIQNKLTYEAINDSIINSQNEFRDILNTTNFVVTIVETDGSYENSKIIWASKNIIEICDYTDIELFNESFQLKLKQGFNEDQVNKLNDVYKKASLTKKSQIIKLYFDKSKKFHTGIAKIFVLQKSKDSQIICSVIENISHTIDKEKEKEMIIDQQDLFFKSTTDIVFFYDWINHKLLYSSPTFKTTLGYNNNDKNINLLSLVHPNEKKETDKKIKYLLKKQNKVFYDNENVFNVRLRHSNNTYHWYHCKLNFTKDNYQLVHARPYDKEMISEEFTNNIKQIFNNMHEVLFLSNWDEQNIQMCSPSVKTHFGFSVEEFMKYGLTNIHPDDIVTIKNARNKISLNGNIPCHKFRFLNKNNNYVWVSSTGTILQNGLDLIHLKVMENEIKTIKLQDRLESIFNNIEDIIILYNHKNDKIEMVSPSVKLLGYEDYIYDINLTNIIHIDDSNKFLKNTKNKIIKYSKYKIKHKDGSWNSYGIKGTTLEDKTQLLHLRNIEEELKIEKMREVVARAEITRTHSASQSHEIRNLVQQCKISHNIIIEMIQNRNVESFLNICDDNSLNMVQMLKVQTERLQAVCDASMSFYKETENSKKGFLDLQRLWSDFVVYVNSEKDIKLSLSINLKGKKEIPFVDGVYFEWFTVLTNLYSNAKKASLGFYENTINSPQVILEFIIESKDEYVDLTICVEDSGPGFQKDYENIGNLYHQSKITNKGSGYGIFTICKIPQSNLIIDKSSKLGGAKVIFTKTFNLSDNILNKLNDLQKTKIISKSPINKTKKKILIVEDDIRLFKLMKIQLRDFVSIENIQNGSLAVEKLKNNTYDLVTIDKRMPVMEGPEAVKIIRSNGYKGLIWGFTGSDLEEDIQYFKDCGVNKVFVKGGNCNLIELIKNL